MEKNPPSSVTVRHKSAIPFRTPVRTASTLVHTVVNPPSVKPRYSGERSNTEEFTGKARGSFKYKNTRMPCRFARATSSRSADWRCSIPSSGSHGM